MENCLAGGDEWRGSSGPLKLERGPSHQPADRRVLRGDAAGRISDHLRRQRLPAGGLRPLRPQRVPRPPPQRCSRLSAPGDEPRLTSPSTTRALVHKGALRRHTCDRCASTSVRGKTPLAEAAEVVLCGCAARNTPQLLQLKRHRQREGVTSTGHPRSCTTCRPSVSTCRTTSRSTCSTCARSRCRCSKTCSCGVDRGSDCSGCSARVPVPATTSRWGGFTWSNDEVP